MKKFIVFFVVGCIVGVCSWVGFGFGYLAACEDFMDNPTIFVLNILEVFPNAGQKLRSKMHFVYKEHDEKGETI